jgi:hypothetical protein
MALAAKLQLKPGQTVALVNVPAGFDGEDLAECETATPTKADLVLVFAVDGKQLERRTRTLVATAQRGALTWVAYPKAGQLGTDLNRDRLRESVLENGLDTVRQVALDDTWSALRLKPS